VSRKKSRYLSIPEIQLLNDKDFAEYLEALLQLSNEDKDAEYLAHAIWSEMTPEQRIVMLKYMGGRSVPQGQA